jgi:proline iminopeptidase
MRFPFQGIHLYYEQFSGGMPLVVLHGGPGFSHSYLKPFLLPLAEECTLYFLDFSSHGLSDDRPINGFLDLAEEVEALRRHLGLERFALLGHSMGGHVAQVYASLHPDRLSHLILVSTSPRSPSAFSKHWKMLDWKQKMGVVPFLLQAVHMLARKRPGRLMLEYTRTMLPAFVKHPEHRQTILDGYTASHKKECPSLFAIMKDFRRLDLRSNKGRVTCPVLILCGDGDVGMRDFQTELQSIYENSEMVWLDAGHDPYVEDPHTFVRTVLQFLRNHRQTAR